MIFRASARATALRTAPLVAVVALMTWFKGTDAEGALTWSGYVCLALAALVAFPIAANLIWPPTLVLGTDALVCRWWWLTTTIPWSDIKVFRVIAPKDQLSRRVPHLLPWNILVARTGTRAKIGLDYRKGAALDPARERARWHNQTSNLCDWAVPNVWNLPAAELVRRLNEHLATTRSG